MGQLLSFSILGLITLSIVLSFVFGIRQEKNNGHDYLPFLKKVFKGIIALIAIISMLKLLDAYVWNLSEKRLTDLDPDESVATFIGHSAAVNCLAISPDGTRIVSGGEDNNLRLWNLHQLRVESRLKGHQSWVNDIAYSPDGKKIASVSGGFGFEHVIHIWSGQPEKMWSYPLCTIDGHESPIYTVDYSPDSAIIVSAGGHSDNLIKFWETKSCESNSYRFGHSATVWAARFGPTYQWLVSSSADGTIRVWYPDSMVRVLTSHRGNVFSVEFSPNGRYIASGGSDSTLRIWDVASGRLLRTLYYHKGAVNDVAFSHSGELIAAAGADKKISLWNVATGTLLTTLEGHRKAVNDVLFTNNERFIISASDDKTIKIWRCK